MRTTGPEWPEILERFYEPFFTTKEVGAGSGLGLSMVYGFIAQSGGEVDSPSAPGEGTTVSLHLPRSATAAERERSGRALLSPEVFRGRGETVLVVDDDPGVRHAAVDMLRSLGCRALEAEDAAAALACLDATPELALMLVDVVLPGAMNGPELVAEARRRRSTLKVLYSSGYTRNALVRDGHLDPGVDLLQKPYRPGALAR